MKVLITEKIDKSGIQLLRNNNIDVEILKNATKSEILNKTKNSNLLITMLGDQIDKEFLESSSHLLGISNYAVGYNNIDVKTATELGIPIGNTPNVLTNATADLALTLLMSVSRKVLPATKSILEGSWRKWEPLKHLGIELNGKTLGIFGMGRIGQSFAKKCHYALGMKIIYCSNKDVKLPFKTTKVSFNELLKKSDVLSVHAPLTDMTDGIFNKITFKQMKKKSIFINSARGQIHNEEDLFEALSTNHLFGAGLDVTNPEPMLAPYKLMKLSNVVVLPHIGSGTFETRKEMSIITAKNILASLNKESLPGFVNPEVYGNKYGY